MNIWDQIKHHLQTKLDPEAFANWLGRSAFLDQRETTLTVNVPNDATREWLQIEYAGHVRDAIRDLRLPITEIRYLAGPRPSPTPSSTPTGPLQSWEPVLASLENQLNSRYTFNSFIVGSCNQFAHAAAKAVAAKPARRYNPLFVYGGSGMGKTHLIHAIGNSLLENYPTLRVVYTTSERFMNQMIHCIKSDRIPLFHQHYRSADILLLDDIQVLANRERTQEEFFHTFNELFEHQKQIVVSSDSPPKATAGLTDRVRSRFEWGLLVDVQPPDLETKMAILDSKAEDQDIKLPEDVRIYIATKTKANVRELEGALIKLSAFASVTGSPITLDMAKQVLRHLSTGSEKRVTIEAIVKAVAERFGMQPAHLKQKSNMKHIVRPRQIAMYLAKELTLASLPEIGRAFGGKHHTTVLHSIQTIEKFRHRDPEINRTIHSLIDSFQ
jgi:chromosomal replication initiator protein